MRELCYKEDVLDLFYTAAINQDKNFTKTVEMVIEETPTVYAWHDLRKNPDDLPDVETEVEVVNDDGKHAFAIYREDTLYGENVLKYWRIKYCPYDDDIWNEEDGKIIAWREIEPFGGEE